jgi:hypothetical protein
VEKLVRNGIRLHKVIADDSLMLGAVKIDTNEWVECECKDVANYYPLKGKQVLVIEVEKKLYWFAIYQP